MTAAVLDAFKEADICIVNVPANLTKYYQPLDLTVIGYPKRYLKRKFIEWYSGQVKSQLDKNISIEDIQVGLQLTKLKPIHAGWLVEFYNHMTTTKGKYIIDGGWKASGIFDAIPLGSEKMPSIDPFRDIDPMLGDDNRQVDDNSHLLAVCDVTIEEFELLRGSKIQRYIGEDVEESYFFCSFAKVFSRENKLFPRFAKVFSTKFVPKTAKRKSLFHKFRVFLTRESFCPRKFLPLK